MRINSFQTTILYAKTLIAAEAITEKRIHSALTEAVSTFDSSVATRNNKTEDIPGSNRSKAEKQYPYRKKINYHGSAVSPA